MYVKDCKTTSSVTSARILPREITQEEEEEEKNTHTHNERTKRMIKLFYPNEINMYVRFFFLFLPIFNTCV